MTPTSLITDLFFCLNAIYKQLTLAAVYRIDPPVTIPNLYLVLAPYLINIIYKNKAVTNTL